MAMVGHHEGDTFVDDRDVVCGVNCWPKDQRIVSVYNLFECPFYRSTDPSTATAEPGETFSREATLGNI